MESEGLSLSFVVAALLAIAAVFGGAWWFMKAAKKGNREVRSDQKADTTPSPEPVQPRNTPDP